jgi:3',5'-cyclic AMP phosphodiesterase CpdA
VPPSTTPARAAAACALALAAAACAHDVHVVDAPRPPSPGFAPELRVLVFGDWGGATLLQRLVADGLHRAVRREPFDLALQVGDNIYPCGPDAFRPGAETCAFAADGRTLAPGALPPDDPRFEVNEAPLRGLRGRDGGPLPIFLALGNHDVGLGRRCTPRGEDHEAATRRRACLQVARSTDTWKVPARSYVLDRGAVRLVVIDTNVVERDYGGFTLEDELAFLDAALAPCARAGQPGRTCFVFGHHPPAFVIGWRPQPSSQQARMARLVETIGGRARGFFAGHLHTLEHVRLGPLEVFVSGSTAMGSHHRFRWVVPGSAVARFATSAWGWTVLEVGAGAYRVRFHAWDGAALYCCESIGSEACRSVSCG